MVVTFGTTLLIAVVTTRLIEIPILRLRDRWLKSSHTVQELEKIQVVYTLASD
jgi:peptidoglycan/LPS O-acetylase OafA/YrhL